MTTKTPWQKLLDELKAIYGAEDDPHDPDALDHIRRTFEFWYAMGEVNGAIKEASRR